MSINYKNDDKNLIKSNKWDNDRISSCSRSKRNKSDSDQEFNDQNNDYSKARLLRNKDSNSPLKRANNNSECLSDESPKKRLKIPDFQDPIPIKKFNFTTPKTVNKASISLCIENEHKKFASTPKSERKTSATSRVKSLNNSAAIDRNLSNNWADIIEDLEVQTKELNEYVDKIAAKYKLDKDLFTKQLETDAETLRKRQKRINFGKVTKEYERYRASVDKKKREQFHPRTPNKFRKCSRRKFDGLVKKWRKMLHVWDENPEALQDFKYSMENDDPEDEKSELEGCSAISYNVDDYEMDYEENTDNDGDDALNSNEHE